MSKKMPRYLKVFLFALLIELITSPLRVWCGMQICAVVDFSLFFAFQYAVSKKYEKKLNVHLLFIASLLGCSLLQLSLRIWIVSDSLVSLPDYLFHLFGIVMGYWFYLAKNKIIKVVIVLISVASCIFISFKGYEMWLNYLNHNTFTGILNNQEKYSFEFQTAEGDTVTLADFKGKYVVVDHWSTYCGICYKEFPKVQQTYDKYKDDSGIAIFSLHSRSTLENTKKETVEKGTEILKKKKYSFPCYSIDCEDPILRELGVNSYPTVLIFDRESRLIFRGSIENAKKHIEKLIN